MFRPFLVVGIGGSGGKTLRAARQALQSKLDLQGWEGGWPQAWQLLHIDSEITQDGLHFPAPLLPLADYLSLNPSRVRYKAIYDKAIQGLDSKVLDVQRVLPAPDDFPPINSSRPDMRALGRTIAIGAMKEIHDKVQESLGKMQSTSADAELKEITRLFGAEVSASQTPTVIVISSVVGLSGSGMFIDVAEAIKAAIGPEEWAHRIFSLLFAPDVFEELGRGNLSYMSGNAMGALAELMSGFWRSAPTEGMLALYKKHGLDVPQDPRATIGPGFNYIIGRKSGLPNSFDFGSQSDVYMASGNSLAAWITDAAIQDGMSAYAVTSHRLIPQDNTQLATSSARQPLSSLGFARVTLGTDRFIQYAAERLAKQTLETLLRQHILTAPLLPGQTEEEWVEHFTNLNEGTFISECGLDDLAGENNQVVEALNPDTAELHERFKQAISTAVAAEIPAGGRSHEEWTSLMVNAYQAILPDYLEDLSKLVQEKAREWVQKMPEKILTLVAQTASRHGLPVTAKLLERLVQRTMAGAKELTKQQPVNVGDSGAIIHTVAQAMQPAVSMESVPRAHPAIAQALTEMELAIYSASMADIRNNAGELMVDFSENFLEPLRRTLSHGYFALKDATADYKLPDGTLNIYGFWPSDDGVSVPKRFRQAPNDSVLIDIDDFPSEFDTLVQQTVNDSTERASRIVIEEVVMGSRSRKVSKLQEHQQWDIAAVKQAWIPKNPRYQLRPGANQSAQFSLIADHMEYLQFAKKWMMIPGRAFRGFLDQTIASYLQADGNQAAQSARSRKFLAAVRSAIESADPLVELDPKLLEATHGQIRRVAFSSGIPIEKTDPLRGNIDDALVSNGYDPDKGWYISGSKATNAKSIEIITQLTSAISPIPMASLMRPIAEAWSASSTEWSSRGNFMQWRRARPLPESIPASPDLWHQMLAGWYLAKFFGHISLENDPNDPSLAERGPRVRIWENGGAEGWMSFPYPLYYPRISPIRDLVGIVMESMTVAMLNSFSAGSLDPLVPYQRLSKLGDLGSSDSHLAYWIRKGKLRESDAPVPVVAQAGGPTNTIEGRKELAITYFWGQLAGFEESLARQDKYGDILPYPVSWEIRVEIREALNRLIRAIA